MTVTTINPVITNVMFVTELHWLRTGHILPRKIGRTRQTHYSGQGKACQENPGEETKPGDKIRTAMKNLGHVCICRSGL
jgi:hypothetical protein